MPRKNRVTQRRAMRSKIAPVEPQRPRRWLVGFVVILVTVVLSAGVWWAYPVVYQKIETTYQLTHIQIEGRTYAKPEELTTAAGLKTGMPLGDLDVNSLQISLRRVPWVDDVGVERHFPDRVIVRLRERPPLARWRIGDKLVVVDTNGKVVEGVASESFAHLPLIAGVGAPHHFTTVRNLMSAWSIVADNVTEMQFIGQRRWNLVLRGTLVVLLPERGVEEALSRAATILEKESLLERGITRLDVRLPDRLALQVAGEKP